MEKDKTFPVVEIFGPVIQGEGVMAGHQTHFLRMGGCDFRCAWCDSMYAVLPEDVQKNAKRMTEPQIIYEVNHLQEFGCKTLTISGGNPLMHDLTNVVQGLKKMGWKLVVETQGTIWRDWLYEMNLVTISPKPPSSGMKDEFVKALSMMGKLNDFWSGQLADRVCVKIVIADHEDFRWAHQCVLDMRHSNIPIYFQPVTIQTELSLAGIRDNLLTRTAEVTKWVTEDPVLSNVRIMPQVHSLVYGYARGV